MTWLAGIDTRSVGDTGSSVVVVVVAAVLMAAGVALAGITVWFWRSTRPDPEALAPLLVMSSKQWRLGNQIERRRALDLARPGEPTALPEPTVDDSVVDEPVVGDPAVDEPVVHDVIPESMVFASDEPVVPADAGLFDDLDEDSDLYDADPVNSGPIERTSSSPIDPLLGR